MPKHYRLKREQKKENTDIVPVRDFMLSAGEHYSEIKGRYPDIIAFISLHAVNRNKKHIEDAINILRVTENDSVFSVIEEREPVFSYGQNGIDLINKGRFKNLVFDRERLYRFNGAVIATWWETLQNHSFLGTSYGILEMSSEDSFQVKSDKDLLLIPS